MISIRIAKNIGFCAGVKRAIDIVQDTLSKSKNRIYCLGPVIHNPRVIQQLEDKGLTIINSLDQAEDSATVILPSHGSPASIFKDTQRKNLRFIDVTCPYVSSVHRICNRLYRQGLKVVIIGDKKHPEIKALRDLVKSACVVIEKTKDIPKNKFSYQRIGIISQTTQAKDNFFGIVGRILQKNPKVLEVHIYNTICLDTLRRQEEVKKLGKDTGVLLVIGSSTSANTKRLFSLGRKINKNTYLIEKEDAPLNKILKNTNRVGIISGASTPEWLIKEVITKIRKGGNVK